VTRGAGCGNPHVRICGRLGWENHPGPPGVAPDDRTPYWQATGPRPATAVPVRGEAGIDREWLAPLRLAVESVAARHRGLRGVFVYGIGNGDTIARLVTVRGWLPAFIARAASRDRGRIEAAMEAVLAGAGL